MNLKNLIPTLVLRFRERPYLFGGIGLAAVALLGILIATSSSPAAATSVYVVKRGDFLISVVEGGTLEAVNEVSIRNDMEGSAREGTARIIFIVPEGTYVKKGQLLVELDSSLSQDAANQQEIAVEKARFAVVQADQQMEIQKSIADGEVDAALLRVKFAESDLNKYREGEMVQLRRNAQIEITNVLENLRIAEDRLEWSEKLFKNGYENKANLDKDRLAVSQTKLRLEQAEKSLWMLETFDEPKRNQELEADLEEAKENLERVKLQAKRKLEQFEADLSTQKRTLELSLTKLERDKRQVEAAKIRAPQDGLVVYATPSGGGRGFSSDAMIEEGAVVRNRQELIKLPDVSEMKVQVRIHESHINQIQTGLPAFVVLDSMPDQRFRGVVAKVAPLPESASRFMNANLKVYATEIRVTDPLPNIKPGVSARAEIIITNLQNVLTVPIQAVTTRQGRQVVFTDGTPARTVPVTVGMYNNKFIELTSGVKEGDRVLLSPPLDMEGKDLGGSVIAAGEQPPQMDSNQVARVLAQTRENAARGGGEPRARGGAGNTAGEIDEGAPAGERRRGNREGRGNAANREEMLKQFDKNGDGQLDDEERAAMRERFGGRRGRGGTNAPPDSVRSPAAD